MRDPCLFSSIFFYDSHTWINVNNARHQSMPWALTIYMTAMLTNEPFGYVLPHAGIRCCNGKTNVHCLPIEISNSSLYHQQQSSRKDKMRLPRDIVALVVLVTLCMRTCNMRNYLENEARLPLLQVRVARTEKDITSWLTETRDLVPDILMPIVLLSHHRVS